MAIDFDTPPFHRRQTESEKWLKYDDEVLPLWVADMDFASPEPVVKALSERVEHRIFGYPQGSVNPAYHRKLRQIIVDRLAELYNWKVNLEELIFLPGVIVGFNLACQAFSEPGSNILVQTPVYPPFLSASVNGNLIKTDVPLLVEDNGYNHPDFSAMEENINSQTSVFMLCNPHNPVGRVFSKKELEKIAEICLKNKIVICSDEIHSDLIFSGNKHIPIASLDKEIARNSVTLISPSKTYNLSGLQCSIAIIQNRDNRNKFIGSFKGLVSWVNLMGLIAAQAAYSEGQEWLTQLLVYLEGNRDFLSDFIQKELPEIKMVKPEGTYLAWLDCREFLKEENPADFFLKQAKVALNDGEAFGLGGKGFTRLNFGCPRFILEMALERMKKAAEKIKKNNIPNFI